MLNTPMYASPTLKSKFLDHSGFIKNTRHSLTLSRKLPYVTSFFEIEQGLVDRISFIDCNFNLKISWGKMCRFCHEIKHKSMVWLEKINDSHKCQYHEIVGNKAQRANLKTDISRKQSTANFPKNEHSLPPEMHMYMCVSVGKKCSFFGKFGVL